MFTSTHPTLHDTGEQPNDSSTVANELQNLFGVVGRVYLETLVEQLAILADQECPPRARRLTMKCLAMNRIPTRQLVVLI